jgi:hypothetical protein
MPGARCARSLACSVESTRVSHHGHTGDIRHSPRNGFNGFLRALLGDRAFLSPSPARLRSNRRRLDASVGASGPPAVRLKRVRLSRQSVHRIPHPTFVTIAKRPLKGDGTRIAIFLFLPSRQAKFGKSEINLRTKTDAFNQQIGQSIVPRLLRNRTYPGHAEMTRM